MNKKEIKTFAKKIAKLEIALHKANDAEKKRIEEEIMLMAGKVKSLDDMALVDELVQDILKKELSADELY